MTGRRSISSDLLIVIGLGVVSPPTTALSQALARYDDLGEECPSGPTCIPMSTAIARIWTSDGFVVAADGRQTNSLTREVMTDSAQKIFPVEHPHRKLAYAIAG